MKNFAITIFVFLNNIIGLFLQSKYLQIFAEEREKEEKVNSICQQRPNYEEQPESCMGLFFARFAKIDITFLRHCEFNLAYI